MTDRNLNPHAEAIAAMHLFGSDYGPSGLGCMDYYDRLPKRLKRRCVDLVEAILATRTRRAPPLEPVPALITPTASTHRNEQGASE